MIDLTKEMILLKGEVKTSSIRSCRYNPDSKKWDVVFNNGKQFSYAYDNVERIRDPKSINTAEYQMKDGSTIINNVRDVYAFYGRSGCYYNVFFDNGYSKVYPSVNIQFVKTALDTKKSKNVWEYFKGISEINDLRNDDGEKILRKQYDKIGFVGEDNALSPYLNQSHVGKKNGRTPIFPFGCNSSQYKAVENAINNQVSVIQGPPGTGKTQTILNIIANLLLERKSIQVVSNNNSAIENVQEKLEESKYNLGFIVAKLGKVANKKEFINAQVLEYPDFSQWKYKGNAGELLLEIQDLSQKLRTVYSNQEEIAKLTHEKASIEVERKHFDQYVKETSAVIDEIALRKNAKTSDILQLWQMWMNRSEDEEAPTFWKKIVLYFKYGLKDYSIYEKDSGQVVLSLQAVFYEKRIQEIEDRITKLNKEIAGTHVDTKELAEKSMQYLKHMLAQRYSGKTSRTAFSEDDFWKNPQQVLNEYPVTLSTTYASKSSLGSKVNTVQYDYIIMDEASQVDIATGALAMSSAFNAVIVGDTKQLPNVLTDDDREKAERLFKQYDLPEGYKYTKSFLQSVLDIVPDIPMTLLKEHYRCHPKIINFCNQKFYDGELIVMTKDNGEENVISAFTTVAGHHERERYNQRQIDVIKQEIIPNLECDLSSVGIISPYRKQVEALRKELPGVDIDTVHKFQGREKDTIIISTVDDEKNDFSDDPFLINVAVSRAKKHLYIVAADDKSGDGNINDLISYIRYNNCEVTESKVYSVFDYLYSNYTAARFKYLQSHKKVSEYDSENLMYALISDLLKSEGKNNIGVVCHMPLNLLIRDVTKMTEEEAKYAMNPLTHLDFTLYSKISKKVLAAIEVDGYAFHKSGTRQSERDLLKNSILEKYEIPLLRFATNGSGEKERLHDLLSKI